MDIQTLCIHGCNNRYDSTGSISVPIYQSATFAHPGIGQSSGFDYSRLQNPTREHLEKTVAGLEHGVDALAFSSGMAAISTVMELFSPSDHIISSDDLYGGSHRLFKHISEKNGLTFDFVDTSDINTVRSLIQPNTRAIFVETPTNPMMHVTDIAAVSELAKAHHLLLIVDNTFLSPYFQRPLDLGADIVIHSGTKFLGGHNDTLAGFLVVSDTSLSEKLRFIHKTTGACLSALDSWLIIRGIKTLAVRMEKQQENAFHIAEFLSHHEKIKSVHYVGLSTHPGYKISKRQTTGFGSMISIVTKNATLATHILERLKVIQYAESLGGVESLITYPKLQTHADVPEDDRERKGINDCLLRLSVGLENANDLINDLNQAMEDDYDI